MGLILSSYLTTLFQLLVEALHKEPDTEICASMLDALNECIQVGEILGTLIKKFKASFLPLFDELSSYLTPMLVSSASSYPFMFYVSFVFNRALIIDAHWFVVLCTHMIVFCNSSIHHSVNVEFCASNSVISCFITCLLVSIAGEG